MPLLYTRCSISYDDTVVSEQEGEYYAGEAPISIPENYQTIEFLEEPTGELLEWLQNNANKQE